LQLCAISVERFGRCMISIRTGSVFPSNEQSMSVSFVVDLGFNSPKK
jgi:hypothetical protein